MSNVKKKSSRILIVFLVILILIVGLFLFIFLSTMQKTRNADVHEVDISAIEDGNYVGESDLGLVYVKVEVTVKDHKIENIVLLEHRNGKGQPAERIATDIVEQQKIDVDIVSGATCSSVAIKAAVVDALT